MGHAITVDHPLRVIETAIIPGIERCYAVGGTPADCVKMGIQALGIEPDVVVSGVNQGANLGTDVLYSGTVSAAVEAVLLGYAAMAVSLCSTSPHNFPAAGLAVAEILGNPNVAFPDGGLLNVNVPDLPFDEIKGFKATK